MLSSKLLKEEWRIRDSADKHKTAHVSSNTVEFPALQYKAYKAFYLGINSINIVGCYNMLTIFEYKNYSGKSN